jgi:glycosyltransferase involved in cell wall biosynthesis
LFIAVGHLEKRKNFEDAIRAMALSGLERDGWSLAIVGKGPEEERLLTLIKDLGLTATTVHPPTADIGSWYARARFQLVTATLEVFSLVLVEGARSGVIPLCYATDGPSFILRDHADLLVPIGDYDNMAERMKRLVAEDDEDLISRAGRLQANLAQRFSTREIGQQWLRLFQ